jgi:hypothetical protein
MTRWETDVVVMTWSGIAWLYGEREREEKAIPVQSTGTRDSFPIFFLLVDMQLPRGQISLSLLV